MRSCSFCGEEYPETSMYQRVSGWERPRKQGGTNHIHERETEDRYACRTCIELRKLGVHAQQGGLFDE